MGEGGNWCFFLFLFVFFLCGIFFIFHSNKYLAFGEFSQATLLPASSALSYPEDPSISQPEGWVEKTSHFHFTGNRGTEKQSDCSRLICSKAESPDPNPTLWVILALYAFHNNRFGPRNQATFMLNAA